MKAIVSYSVSIFLILIFFPFPLSAQTIDGPAIGCPNTPTTYTLTGCNATSWEVIPNTATLSGGTSTKVNATFPLKTTSQTYSIIAYNNCPGGLTTFRVEVRGSSTSSQTVDVKCNYLGTQTFEVSQNYVDWNTTWTNSQNWPKVSQTVYKNGQLYYSRVIYNITNSNPATITASVSAPECPNVPTYVETRTVTRSLSNDLVPPVFSQSPAAQCPGTPGTYTVQPYANAISYTWDSDQKTMKINGQTPPVTISAANNGNSVTVVEPNGILYSTSITVTAQTNCGTTYPAGAVMNSGLAQPTVYGDYDPLHKRIMASVFSVPGATSYQWSLDGVVKSTTTSTNALLSVGSTTICSHEVAVMAIGPSCNSSYGYGYFNSCTSLAAADYFKVYPNPAKGTVAISLDDTQTGKASKLATTNVGGIQEARIIGQTGDIIKVQKFGAGTRKATIDVSGILPGTYIVNIFDGKQWVAKKLIIVE